MPGKERITYGNITKDDVSKIVVEHIVNGKIVEDLAVAKLED